MAYVYGVQAAQDRLAKARAELRKLHSEDEAAAEMVAEAERIERLITNERKRRHPTYTPRATENIHGGPAGLRRAVAESDEYNARKRAERKAGAV